MAKTKNRDIPVALEALQLYTKKYPGIWNECAKIYNTIRENNYLWDDRCYVPLDVIYCSIDTLNRFVYKRNPIQFNECSIITALASWRFYKQIYTFDSDLANVLFESASEDVNVFDSLTNLPYPSFYIELSDDTIMDCNGMNCYGFFVTIDCNAVPKEHMEDEQLTTVNFVGFTQNGRFDCSLIIEEGMTIREAFKKYRELAIDNNSNISNKELIQSETFIIKAIQLILYLCAINSEITINPRQKELCNRKDVTEKLSTPKDVLREVVKHDVGYRIGKAIRLSRDLQERESTKKHFFGSSKSKSPHVRRGHYHHYWVGSKKDRHLELRWTPPTFIHSENYNMDNNLAVITPVKK